MDNFKKNWDIKENWQLLFPLLGIIGLYYSGYKIAAKFFSLSIIISLILAIPISLILLKITLSIFKRLEKKWKLTYRWEMIRVFIVFAITGTSSLYVSRPIIALIGITKENLNPILYWFLFIIIGLIFYQILLVTIGWLFGQFKFFWEFEKKMLYRFGIKRFKS